MPNINKQTLGKIMHIRINRCLTKTKSVRRKTSSDFIWPILIFLINFHFVNSSNIFNGVTKFVKQSLWLLSASTKKIFYGKVPIISMFIFIPVVASFIINFKFFIIKLDFCQDQIGIMLNNYFFESSINDLQNYNKRVGNLCLA